MSRFSEFLPATTTSRELAIPSKSPLTEPQKRQLDTATKSYLKKYGMSASYQNIVKVRDVVGRCVQDGLQQSRDRAEISPSDNLKIAFDRGFNTRQTLITTVQSEIAEVSSERYPSGKDYRGVHSMPEYLLKFANFELSDIHSAVNLDNTSKAYQALAPRIEVFNQFSKFLEGVIKEKYPHSENVELTKLQKGAFFRNMLFNWMTSGEINIDLEITDLISKNDVFSDQQKNKWVSNYNKLLQRMNINPNDDNLRYFYQTGLQIQENLNDISGRKIDSLGAISDANKQLESYFLLTNPFYRLTPISENQEDRGFSIWDEERSQIIQVGNQRMRIPTGQTLEYLSYQYQSTNPEKLLDIGKAIKAVERLNSWDEEEESAFANRSRASLARVETSLLQIDIGLISGQIPDFLRAKDEDINLTIDGQLQTMASEKRLFENVRTARMEGIESSLKMLDKYRNRKGRVDPRDAEELRRLDQLPGWINRRIGDFLRLRLTNRFDYLRDTHRNYNLEKGNMNDNPSFETLSGTTVVDLLQIQSNLWLKDAQYNNNQESAFHPTEILLKRESTKLQRLLTRNALNMAATNPHWTPYPKDKFRAKNWLLGPGREFLIQCSGNDVRAVQGRIADLELNLSQLDKTEAANQDRENWWKERDRSITNSINSLNQSWDIDSPFERAAPITFKRRDEAVDENNIMPVDFEKKLKSASAMQNLVAEHLLKLAPGNLLMVEPIPIESYLKNKLASEEIPDPWRYKRDLKEDATSFFQLRDMIRTYLVDQHLDRFLGYSFDFHSIRRYGLYFSTFFGLEADFNAWREKQISKLTDQQNNPPVILETNLLRRRQSLINRQAELTATITSLDNAKDQHLKNILKPLSDLGFMRIEEE